MTDFRDTPEVTPGEVHGPDAQDTVTTPPEDQQFFDEALGVSVRGMRQLMERRRKAR